jgi:hypothetical protein
MSRLLGGAGGAAPSPTDAMVARSDEHVHPPTLALPEWPSVPEPVDVSGTSFLVIAVGSHERTGAVARDWVRDAESVAPTTLVVLDAVDAEPDRLQLAASLASARTGVRIMVAGGQYDVLMVLARARLAGALPRELTSFVTHSRDLPIYCAHCRDTHRVEAVPGGLVECPGCDRLLEVHAHLSAALGSFLASDTRARDLR